MNPPELLLHHSLYRRRAVLATAEAYAGVCTPRVTRQGAYWRIVFEDADPSVEGVLAAEFANYALAETIEGRH